jgi:hypothetical protein
MRHDFDLDHRGPNNVILSLNGPADWARIGPTDQISKIVAEGIELGPKPPGHQFPALTRLTATWSPEVGSWLTGSRLRVVDIHRPDQGTLDALEGVPVEFLVLQSARWSGPARWPRLEHLERLWFTHGRDLDLTGVRVLPALRSVRVDSIKHLAHLDQLSTGPRLREVWLEDIHTVEDPAQLWTINAHEVHVLGRPATSPWILEALRSLDPDHEAELGAAYSFSEDVLRLAASAGTVPVGPISELNESRGSLIFDPAQVPTAEALQDRGAESTREMWAELVTRWWPQLARHLVLDPDTELFAAYGQVDYLKSLQQRLEPLFTDEAALALALAELPLDWWDP